MKSKVIFYHAGCPVCLEAESKLLHSLDREQHEVETVHFAECPERINEAESLGVRSVPAMVLHNEVFHINFGASIDELKASQ